MPGCQVQAAVGLVQRMHRALHRETVNAPLTARYAARAWLATCPALLLHDAPGSGTKLLTGAFSESPCVESAADPHELPGRSSAPRRFRPLRPCWAASATGPAAVRRSPPGSQSGSAGPRSPARILRQRSYRDVTRKVESCHRRPLPPETDCAKGVARLPLAGRLSHNWQMEGSFSLRSIVNGRAASSAAV
jgi:hypothetical protein